MNASMSIAASAMQGLQQNLDVLAGNMSNADTYGYKRQTVSFGDLLTSVKNQPDAFRQPGRQTNLGLPLFWGMKVNSAKLDMVEGTLQSTENPLDLAIEGDALFEVNLQPDANGVAQRAWTRNGAFQLSTIANDPDNVQLTTAQGYVVMSVDDNPITVPAGYEIAVDAQGNVTATSASDPQSEPIDAGQIKLQRVLRPQLLQTIGDNLYAVDPANVGNALTAVDFINDDPTIKPVDIKQGFLEGSNVDLTVEMTDLMTVQRAYQLSARSLQSSDTMMNLANNLHG